MSREYPGLFYARVGQLSRMEAIDEFRVYNRAPSSDEIVKLYGNSLGLYMILADPNRLVKIDIKTGSYPNSVNIYGKGVIPVAILGSAKFSVNDISISALDFTGSMFRYAAHTVADQYIHSWR